MSEFKGMAPLSRSEILALYTKREQRELRTPDLSKIDWENLDYFGWKHPSGHLGYMIYEYLGDLRGLVLTPTRGSGRLISKICSWCAIPQLGDGITLFSTPSKTDSNRSVGNYACADLQCSLYIRGLKQTGSAKLNETLTIPERSSRLRANLNNFFDQVYK